MKKTIYIIIFCILIFLTGCDMNNKDEDDISKQHDTLRREQIELLDGKMFATLENVMGINFMNYRLVTLKQQIIQNQDNSGNGGSEQKSSEGDQAKEKKENKNIEITEIVDDNTIFQKENEPNWEKAQQYIRQVSDIFIDVQIELSKQNVSQEQINQYGSYVGNLVLDISNKDREKSIKDLEQLYFSMYDILTRLIQDEKIISLKKLYYDLIQLLIQLQQNNETKFNELLSIIKQDVQELYTTVIKDKNTYIGERIKMLIENIDYKKSNDAKLKIVMLVNTLPVLDYTVSQ